MEEASVTGGAEARGPETSSYQLGTAANPGLRGTAKSATSTVTAQPEEEADGELHWLDVNEEDEDEASPSKCSKCFQVPLIE